MRIYQSSRRVGKAYNSSLTAMAKGFRAQHPSTGTGGVVVIYNDDVQGWVNQLRDPQHWVPGCIAIDNDGNMWKAVGGTGADGAERWESIA